MARVVDYIVQNVVGDKVKKYRLEQKLSQKDLAARLETYAIYICRGSISRIENHERTVTDYELRAIAKALRVSIYDLYEDDGFIPGNKEI
ncbi:MAG: helix-turn-helix transcriptional regulator [Bacillota bacterium]|nr:helix-turn-helix transcriptional regulator [Bacillota bacterium]